MSSHNTECTFTLRGRNVLGLVFLAEILNALHIDECVHVIFLKIIMVVKILAIFEIVL